MLWKKGLELFISACFPSKLVDFKQIAYLRLITLKTLHFNRGVGAMELVAMDMKLRGQYIARQLSFHGVSFKIDEIPVPKDFYKVYNESVKLASAGI